MIEEVYSLNDCRVDFGDAAVPFWLLESNGYEEKAQELRGLDWE